MNPERLEIIEKYFDGILNPSEIAELEKQMESDMFIREEVNETISLIKGIREAGRHEFKLKLIEAENQAGPLKIVPFKIRKVWYYAAAVILIMVATGISYWLFSNPISAEKIYAEYYTPYPNVIVPLTRDEKEPDSLKTAFKYYETANFQEAIHYFTLLNPSGTDENLLFYKAISLMSLNQPAEAKSILELLADKNTPLQKQVYYYLALTYLKTDNIHGAKNIAMKIQHKFPTYNNGILLVHQINKLKN